VIAAERREHEEPHLVHCVVNGDEGNNLRRYLNGVASRSHRLPPSTTSGRYPLTTREEEILALLARDKSLHEIADELFLSYSTVRNHTQHVLRKLGVHSILEAVAIHLLNEESS